MADKPHVLLICTDHWPAALRGTAGHPVIQTPTVDALAERGTEFTHTYSECPVCIPARRSLMTGTTPKTHGDRVYSDRMEMPGIPTLAETFRSAGYQTVATGKLHVYPQRNRIGFDEALITEEGRYDFGIVDDYQMWIGEHGYTGTEFLHAMGSNTYLTRPWHLPESAHVTNWITTQAARAIKRRDPTRPGFFYVSYTAPHPPLVPPQAYLDMYDLDEIDLPYHGEWNDDDVYPIQALRHLEHPYSDRDMRRARQAFYASCTHIDHQIRILIGTLREANLLDNTIIAFMSDHGDMLFNHGMVAKRVFYESSTRVPFLVAGAPIADRRNTTDDRLMTLADVMPTLLDLAGIPIPDSVEGISGFGPALRETVYGEMGEGDKATRMVTDGRYKLIYYPTGNYVQLFDLERDPQEQLNRAGAVEMADVQQRLTATLVQEFYGDDLSWVTNGELQGRPNRAFDPPLDIGLYNQRGYHWPPPAGYKNVGGNA
ncbi:MAG: sulfatase-like hydrolase/transferase [Spirochaeta sp.]|jgi:arylsulfatase|nr:sulfatase-like hydrolase/transferase [Spirochaeta sp.]